MKQTDNVVRLREDFESMAEASACLEPTLQRAMRNTASVFISEIDRALHRKTDKAQNYALSFCLDESRAMTALKFMYQHVPLGVDVTVFGPNSDIVGLMRKHTNLDFIIRLDLILPLAAALLSPEFVAPCL